MRRRGGRAGDRPDCRILNTALRRGLTASTAQWICRQAEALGISEREMLKAVLKAATHGVWLGEEEWRLLASTARGRLAKYAEYVARKVKQGYTVAEAVAEIENTPRRGDLTRLLDVVKTLALNIAQKIRP
ncbi:hypothetical protein [Pyrobaculum ferrireducens]|uniref:Uncharacterized protein n=1 Tax=Pyrobaculum ferrireducens TaxID=1104324 RepID=G7VG82_9CREN|nr:hypothetical protein [Pyrobaculum ferrireducens]AET34281.1 hypothetical protein P186_2905 [Pyrobaculum ferrireducens]